MRILLIVPSNGSRFNWYPLGAISLANALDARGHEVRVWHQDALCLPPEAVAREIDAFEPDSVGLGWIAGKVTQANSMSLCGEVRHFVDHVVIGGHAPSSAPEWYLEHTDADAVVVGEAEGLASRWEELSGVEPGKRGQHEPWPRKSIGGATEDLARWYYPLVPAPGASPLDRVAPVLSGHGCPHRCSFCFRLPGQGCRARPVEDIGWGIAQAWARYGVTYIQFQDELLMTSSRRVESICDMMLERHPDIRWSCQGRVDVAAEDPALLPLMYAAGCRFINYGVESTSQRVLDLIGKDQTVEQAHEAMRATLASGISPGVNMLWGLPGDDEVTLWSNVEFIEKYSDHAQRRTIRPVTPYPGSALYHEAVRRGLLVDVGDFYAKLVNSDLITVDFMDMPRADAHRLLLEANLRLLRAHQQAVDGEIEAQARALYLGGDPGFRGWRQV